MLGTGSGIHYMELKVSVRVTGLALYVVMNPLHGVERRSILKDVCFGLSAENPLHGVERGYVYP